MSEKEYIKKTNMNLLSCWFIIDMVLIFSYFIEIFKNLRTLDYVLIFSFITIFPLLTAIIFYILTKGYNDNLKYIASIGYCVFYTFSIFTSQTEVCFVYIIPMISILIVYTDKLLIGITYGYALFINIIKIGLNITNGKNSLSEITFYEIQLACIILSAIFLMKTTKIIIEGNNKLFKLSEDIFKDNLTESYNRKFFYKNIEDFFYKGNMNFGLNLAFIDVDNFKQFNTEYGHNFGDYVLQKLCKMIQSKINILEDTYLIRMGGDEFIIINSSVSVDEFYQILKEICYKASETMIDNNIFINISIGLANSKFCKCIDYLDLYKKADENLYEAKNTGKNKVIFINKKEPM